MVKVRLFIFWKGRIMSTNLVGLTGLNANNYAYNNNITAGNVGLNSTGNISNLLNFSGVNPLATTPYANDIMMQNLDFNNVSNQGLSQNVTGSQNVQNSQVQTQNVVNQTAPQQTVQTPTVQSQVTNQNTSATAQGQVPNGLENYLVQKEENVEVTENGNRYVKTNALKKVGLAAGVLTPLVTKTVKLFKGGSFKQLFNLKQLGIKMPLFALAGWASGAIADGFLNTKKAQAADENAATQQPYQPLNVVA